MLYCQPLSLLQVTTNAFKAAFNLNSAGAVYYVITDLETSPVSIQPGTAVFVGQLAQSDQLLPAPTPVTYSVEPVTVRGEDETLDVHVPIGRRLSSEQHGQTAEVYPGTTPWHAAADMESSYLQGDWLGSVTHRCPIPPPPPSNNSFAYSTHVCS